MPGMEYVRRVLIAVGITTGILVLLALLWYTVDILLLVFAAILLAVLLRAPANWVSAHTPLALALLAGLFSFVPYLGPIVSAVPALLLALSQDQQRALYVLILYIGVQAVEGNLLTPLVQQKAVSLPAAMILFAQIMLGVLVGGIEIVLATPLAAVILVAVKMLYIEDILGDTESAG